MPRHRWLSVLFVVLAAVLWPWRASAAATTSAETRVGNFELVAHAFVGVQSVRNPENRRASELAAYDFASGYRLAAEGGAAAITRGEQVTEQVIRNAMKDAPLSSQQAGGVSLPTVQRYVDKLIAGEVPPAIKLDGSMIVDGNHRYIAGRILGQEPPVIQWLGGRPGGAIPWSDIKISSDW